MKERLDQTVRGAEELVLALLEKVASERTRCPTNPEIAELLSEQGIPLAASTIPRLFSNLTRKGIITVEVYGHNFRRVMILSGQSAGLSTAAPQHGRPPHIVIDASERKRRDSRPRLKRRPRFRLRNKVA